jgi:hypothetical protein
VVKLDRMIKYIVKNAVVAECFKWVVKHASIVNFLSSKLGSKQLDDFRKKNQKPNKKFSQRFDSATREATTAPCLLLFI